MSPRPALWYSPDGQPLDDDFESWGQAMAQAHRDGTYRVGLTTLATPAGQWVEVSTVFLGVDVSFGWGGAPVLYETMVFAPPGDDLDCAMWRYATREQAAAGHTQVATVLRMALGSQRVNAAAVRRIRTAMLRRHRRAARRGRRVAQSGAARTHYGMLRHFLP